MTHGPRRHTTTTDRTARRAPRTRGEPAPRLDPQLMSDAVVASYIHEISGRGRRRGRSLR